MRGYTNVVKILKPDKDGNLKEVNRIPVAPWKANGWNPDQGIKRTSYSRTVKKRKHR